MAVSSKVAEERYKEEEKIKVQEVGKEELKTLQRTDLKYKIISCIQSVIKGRTFVFGAA